jgi:4-hydroxy-tetrahydrodipicolinate synthase
MPVKAAMEIRGYGPGRLRSPLTEITPQDRDRLADLLAEYEEPIEVETR